MFLAAPLLAAAPRPQSPLNAELAVIASGMDYSALEAKSNAEVVDLLAQIREEQGEPVP